MAGWIAVDLDGTLAYYKPGMASVGEIGEPIPAMLERVKRWLADGQEVRIFTARVGMAEDWADSMSRPVWEALIAEQRGLIEAWCERHLGQKLTVTATKDYGMIELWDDRAIQVVPNTGQRVDGCN